MKRIFNLMLVAMVMLVAACENDVMDSVKGENESLSFYAEIAGDTKAYIDDTDGDKTWDTIWETGDILEVSIDGNDVYEFKYDGEKFTCTKDGVTSLVGETVIIMSPYKNKNSYAGKQGWGINGTQVENFSANSTITLEAYTSYFRYTYNGDSDITFTVKVEGENPPYVFQDGSSSFFEEITISDTKGENFIAFWTQSRDSVNATLSYTIDGVKCKEKVVTLAPGKIYNLGTFYDELDAIDTSKRYIFKKATEVRGGKWYAMIAENVAATAVTGDYGYLYTVNPIEVGENENISLPASCAFGFTSTDGGYTIKQADDRYLYMSGDYNSFNVTATPTSGHVFTAEITEGTATIVNVLKNKTVQYSKQHASFGAYSTVTNVLPALYELIEVDNGSHILSVSDSSLSLSADSGEKVLTVTTYGTPAWEAASDQTWAQVDYDTTTGEIVVIVTANEDSEARNATITVTYGTESIPVTIEQAGKPSGDVVEVTDTIDNAFTGVGSVTTYSEWSGKTGTSGAVYAGLSAGDAGTVQLRNKNSNEGIVTTTSGGKVTKIVIKWNTTKTTNTNRTVDIYGSHTAFSQATDMYSSKKADATKIASAKLADATNGVSEIVLDDTYEFVGFRSNSSALYLNSIDITWVK